MSWFRKPSVIDRCLIGFGVVGAVSLFLSNAWIHFAYNASDKISAVILLWTALVIVWYTVETYDLRKSSEKQVKLQEQIMMNEYLPILVVSGPGVVQGYTFNIYLENVGKGIARNIKVSMHGITILKGASISAGKKDININTDHQDIPEILDKKKPETMDAEIIYEDIYGRQFKTAGLKFKLDKVDQNTRYILDPSGWTFKFL